MKKIFLLLVLAGLAAYFGRQAYDDYQKEQAKQEQLLRKPTVDKAEMDRFLPVWAEYMEDEIRNVGAGQLSLGMEDGKEKFLPELVRWLKKRGWNAERFFFVEQRLKTIVKTAFWQEHAQSTEQMLRQSEMDESAVQRMIDEQKQRLTVGKVTPAEVEMVKPDLILISDILDGTKTRSKIK